MPRAQSAPDLRAATRSYEMWLARHVPVVRSDLAHKHRLMAVTPINFLRATFYRRVQLWPDICADLAAGTRRSGAA